MKTVTIWKQHYRPFMLGGDVNAPMGLVVTVGEPVPIGKGFTAYLVSLPDGSTRVAESQTLGIVGDTLEQVRQDVREAHTSVIKQQVATMLEFIKAHPPFVVDAQEFCKCAT